MNRYESQEIRFWENPNGTQETKQKYQDYADFTPVDRKRNYSHSSIDSDFIQFLEGAGLLDTYHNQPALEALLEPYPMINDLPGAPWYDVGEDAKGLAANPRAVVTAGPGMLRDADETNSAATMPMPKKRRLNSDDDEVTSHNNGSPNDLVEVPSVVAGSQPSVAAAPSTSAASAQPQARKAAAVATAPVAQPSEQVSESKQPAAAPAATLRPTPPAAAPTAAAADASGASDPLVKAVLVAKVLTKSDASSKRVILPRIAIEANLPQLASQQVFNFSAQDNAGHTWPLCIKAWANGQNPKPVYVLEQVGEIMKQEKLIAGDALAVLASQDGKFYIEWNTEQARTAAARPTYSAFTFTAAAASAAVAHATPAAAAAGKPGLSAVAVKAEQQQEERTVSPAAPGAFMPGSPCQLLVMGHPTMTKESYLLDDSQELVGSAGAPAAAVAVPQSPAGSAAGVAAAGPSAAQPSPAVGVNGTLHQGGFLVCPRTPGCTRPAGHQGWCLGHKGFKKRGRN